LTVSLGSFRRLRQLVGSTREQLSAAVLLLPDLKDADLGVGDFAVEFAFRHPQVTHYGVVAGDRDCELGKLNRLYMTAFRVMIPSINLALSSIRAFEWL
jgi:hypothetical protein